MPLLQTDPVLSIAMHKLKSSCAVLHVVLQRYDSLHHFHEHLLLFLIASSNTFQILLTLSFEYLAAVRNIPLPPGCDKAL